MLASRTAVHRIPELTLERGAVLGDVTIAFETFGKLNADASNAVLIEHALTGDAHVTSGVAEPATAEAATSFAPGWWEAVVGPGKAIDTNEFYVVCTNSLGGCNGSTGPTSLAADGLPYGSRFPNLTIRDMVAAEVHLAAALGVGRWHAVIGGSMGGARALEYALQAPDQVAKCGVLAAPAFSDADQIAWAMTQLRAIELDPDYCGGDYQALGRFPAAGLGLARQIAHLTYRHDLELNGRFSRHLQAPPAQGQDDYYRIASYLDHQADKLVNRFDAQSYIVLTRALRDHDVRRFRSDNLADALQGARAEFLVMSVDSDRLYPAAQVAELAAALPGRVHSSQIHSHAGHDGFLTEGRKVGGLLKRFIEDD